MPSKPCSCANSLLAIAPENKSLDEILNGCDRLVLYLNFVIMAQVGDPIPSIYPIVEKDGNLFYVNNATGAEYPLQPPNEKYNQTEFFGNPTGTANGLKFDFSGLPKIENGKLYVGLIVYGDGEHPQPVYPNAVSTIAADGTADFDIRKFFSDDANNPSRDFDLTNWEVTGESTVGYRVLNNEGIPLYEGKVGFFGSPESSEFRINNGSIVSGPYLHYQKDGTLDDGARVSFDTLTPTNATISVYRQDGTLVGNFNSSSASNSHEIEITGLTPGTEYEYSVSATSTVNGDTYAAIMGEEDGTSSDFRYGFKTAPTAGSDDAFTFAFTSDGRTGGSGIGGGDRFLAESINAYILKKAAALAASEDAEIFQFTGDLISGYDTGIETHEAEYLAWNRTIEPFASQLPFMVGIGNHDAALLDQYDDGSRFGLELDKFPFETESGEAVFSKTFVNPENGLLSEDGQFYDLDPNNQNFPSYGETTYYYQHGNLAVVNLNSEYLYNPGLLDAFKENPNQSSIVGGLHGYLMDGQIQWLEETLNRLDNDPTVDHIFVTQHTPIFPNSGHIDDDMWYDGNNGIRPVIQGENGENLITKGIIERRDEYLLTLMDSPKVRIVLAGDEHNFNITTLAFDTDIYPEGWEGADIKQDPRFRPLMEMTNGAAGAPYYDQGEVPWTPSVTDFTTQYALSLFRLNGDSVSAEVTDPDTLDRIIDPNELIINAPSGAVTSGTADDDIIMAGNGNNEVRGLAGDDKLFGETGQDTLTGNQGNDKLYGGDGGDLVVGGQGDDLLAGGRGNDILTGDAGNDTVRGGAGSDRIEVGSNDGTILVTDFTNGEDLIGLKDGLTFSDVSIGSSGGNTTVTVAGVQITLQGVDSSTIGPDDFASEVL